MTDYKKEATQWGDKVSSFDQNAAMALFDAEFADKSFVELSAMLSRTSETINALGEVEAAAGEILLGCKPGETADVMGGLVKETAASARETMELLRKTLDLAIKYKKAG